MSPLLGRHIENNARAKTSLRDLSSGAIYSSTFAAESNIQSSIYPLQTRTDFASRFSTHLSLMEEEDGLCGHPIHQQKRAGKSRQREKRKSMIFVQHAQ